MRGNILATENQQAIFTKLLRTTKNTPKTKDKSDIIKM